MPGLEYRGSEKSTLDLHFPIGTHNLEVALKSWESTMEIGKISAGEAGVNNLRGP